MFRNLIAALFVLIGIFSCNEKEKKVNSLNTAMDVGSAFIRNTLDGDLDAASKLLLNDNENQQLFDSYKVSFERLPKEEKKHYKDANYTINKFLEVNDSTTIINYSNDYMKKPMEIKVVRVNKEWKIDFKYTTSGNLPIN